MILYNVTVNVDESIHDEWLDWMKSVHIPQVMATGLFKENKIYKIRTDQQETGYTYSIQYFLNSIEDYEKYIKDHSKKLQEEHSAKYRDKFVAFRTVMEQVK